MTFKVQGYYKLKDEDNFITAIGRRFSKVKVGIEITKDEYDTLKALIDNKPTPSAENMAVKIRENDDGTYDYVEVEVPVVETPEEEPEGEE